MVKIVYILSFLFLSITLNAKNFVEVLPANVDYKNEDISDFSEYLYESFQDAIAKFNYTRDSSDAMVVLKENAIPYVKYSDRIEKFHAQIQKDPSQYLNRRKLSNLFVINFDSKSVLKKLKECSMSCQIPISLDSYRQNGMKKSQELYLIYNSEDFLFTKSSQDQINSLVIDRLQKGNKN